MGGMRDQYDFSSAVRLAWVLELRSSCEGRAGEAGCRRWTLTFAFASTDGGMTLSGPKD